MGLVMRGNDVLNVNLPSGAEQLTKNGSNWLWAVTAVFVVSFLAFWALSFKPLHGERVFHYLFKVSLLVGAISYFAMASDLGFLPIAAANEKDRDASRQIFFAKYIYWVVSFPTAILSLGLMSGVSWATIVFNIFVSWIWVVAYLVSAFTTTNYKWGFFAFGTVSFVSLAVSMMTTGLTSAKRVGSSSHYLMLAGWTCFLWLQYPLAFGLSDGGNRITVTAGFIWFGILDILMVPLLAFAILFFSRKWDYGKMNLHFTQYGRVAKGGDVVEKGPATGGVTGEAAA